MRCVWYHLLPLYTYVCENSHVPCVYLFIALAFTPRSNEQISQNAELMGIIAGRCARSHHPTSRRQFLPLCTHIMYVHILLCALSWMTAFEEWHRKVDAVQMARAYIKWAIITHHIYYISCTIFFLFCSSLHLWRYDTSYFLDREKEKKHTNNENK